MKLKQYHRYKINFAGKWASTSAACMGASLFLLAVYYFGLRELGSIGFGECVLSLLLPLILSIAYIVLLHFLQWNAPGAYGILGAVFCVLLMLGTFSSGNILRILLACIWYGLSALTLLACAGGYLPGRLPASVMFTLALLVRFLAFDLGRLSLAGWIYEMSVLLILAALVCLPMSFQTGKHKT